MEAGYYLFTAQKIHDGATQSITNTSVICDQYLIHLPGSCFKISQLIVLVFWLQVNLLGSVVLALFCFL